jgi:hypothetical protein
MVVLGSLPVASLVVGALAKNSSQERSALSRFLVSFALITSTARLVSSAESIPKDNYFNSIIAAD